jgi:hypothetical protein
MKSPTGTASDEQSGTSSSPGRHGNPRDYAERCSAKIVGIRVLTPRDSA